MATKNYFDLLGDDENEDPFQVVLRVNSNSGEAKLSAVVVKKPAAPPKLSSKPASVAEALIDGQRGEHDGGRGRRGGGRGGRVVRGYNGDRDWIPRDGNGHGERTFIVDRSVSQTREVDGFVGARRSTVEKPLRLENGEGRSYGSGRDRGRGRGRGLGGGEDRPRRREFDRHSGNVRGNESEKRAGAGRGNWGSEVDATVIQETVGDVQGVKFSGVEGYALIKPEMEVFADLTVEEVAADAFKEEDEEDNEMTLEEYEKVLEGKRKALVSDKVSERKVEMDKAFKKMQLVDSKKREDTIIKRGQGKEKVKKDAAEREERSRKPVSINEFLKPAEDEMYYSPPSNRGRGSWGGRGDRREGGGRGDRGFSGGRSSGSPTQAGTASAPKIEDQAQFPTLGGK